MHESRTNDYAALNGIVLTKAEKRRLGRLRSRNRRHRRNKKKQKEATMAGHNDVGTLHIHIYDQNSDADDNLVYETNLVLEAVYDDYYQFGYERNDEWIEIRVPKEKEKEE